MVVGTVMDNGWHLKGYLVPEICKRRHRARWFPAFLAFWLLQDVKVITTHQMLHISVLPFQRLSFRGLNRLSTSQTQFLSLFITFVSLSDYYFSSLSLRVSVSFFIYKHATRHMSLWWVWNLNPSPLTVSLALCLCPVALERAAAPPTKARVTFTI